jgi:CDP-diacylglycerol--glycerol-3-phosphate 3-phosphatidyltransferase
MANVVTFLRLCLLFGIFAILDSESVTGHLWAFFLTVLLIALDGADGAIARRLNETSGFGAVFDIVVDRIVENCFWIYFAVAGVISVWIPFVILSRGFFTDGIRAVALTKGSTAFGEKSMQRSLLGRALVSSRWSRGLYGLSKVLAFLVLIVLKGMSLPGAVIPVTPAAEAVIKISGHIVIYFTVAFCIVRAIPVLIESRPFFSENN